MIADEDVVALIGAVQENAQRLGLIWTLTPGAVVDTSPLTVRLDSPDGDTGVAIPVVSLLGDLPVGVRVMVMTVPPAGQYVVGITSPAPFIARLGTPKSAFGVSGTGTTTSGPYVALPGSPGFNDFTKLNASTLVEMHMSNTYFVSVGATGVQMALNLNSTNYDMHFQSVTQANVRVTNTGYRLIAGIPAGTYTVTGMWSRAGGTGVLNQAATGDWNSILVKEIPA